jgi:DNA-binding NarL/FixJ family response regulator
MKIRVLIADDQSMVRAGFRMLLSGEQDIEVAAEARDGLEAVTQAARLDPTVILMDWSARPAPGWALSSRWAGPGRRWTTRSSSPGTRPLSSSSAQSSTSAPGQRPGPRVSTWIEDYNTRRRHSALGMMTPVRYEQALQEQAA